MTRAQAAAGGSATKTPTRAQAAAGGSATRTRANVLRGEATLAIAGKPHVLRPTFAALVAAEDDLGPLLALVERAGEGQLRLSEIATLFWHCLAERDGVSREQVGEAVAAQGLAQCAAPLRALLGQILQGAG